MSVANLFSQFRDNLTVQNAADISTKYKSITTRLNLDFWGIDSDTRYSLQIGSYGRHTAIDGISDLDMVFELPLANLERYRKLEGNGPSQMLQEVRTSLLKRYPNSDVRADGQIVAVNFAGYRVEVLPAFLDKDGNYLHGDTNDGGRWKTTMPRPEIAAVNALNIRTSGVFKNACKMLRAWKNRVGLSMGGLLIDTVAYNFFIDRKQYDDAAWDAYPVMLVSLFTYLGGLDEQDYWLAPGSNQRVKCKKNFQARARKAAARCQEAIDASTEAAQARLWRKVFGRQFPRPQLLLKAAAAANDLQDKEEFIEDMYPVDVRYDLDLDCEVRNETRYVEMLRAALLQRRKVPVGRNLVFSVADTNVPEPFDLYWKVRNRGEIAQQRGMRRGEITKDKGFRRRPETTNFAGDHYVEAYAIKDGVCVAKGRIPVPI